MCIRFMLKTVQITTGLFTDSKIIFFFDCSIIFLFITQSYIDIILFSVFLKICTFLKSHLESVRRVARETLQKIMLTLGPKYLKMLLGEIAPLMNRGFQVHVLVFTVHGVLNCLKGSYEPHDIDEVLLTVLNVSKKKQN